jgi:hypothetical protein
MPTIPLVLAIDCLASAEYLVAAGFHPAVATYLALHTTNTLTTTDDEEI